MQAIQMLQLNNRFVLLSITEQQKREQETPEETIDMTVLLALRNHKRQAD
jgi:hypothetical protein